MSAQSSSRAALAGLLFVCGALVTPAVSAATLEQILARFDDVQVSMHTISADFKETTSNALLKQPIVSVGRFYMTKPDSIRWEYVQPEEMRFVIHRDEYTGYFPARKEAEQRNIRRFSERIFRFIGLGQASSELEKFYDVRLDHEATSATDRHVLLFEPKRKRVRKRVDEVRFWIDPSTFLPTRVEYHGASGSTRVIEFSGIRLNPDLAASLYEVELPPGVKITKGFGSLPGLEDDDASAAEAH